MNELFYQEIRIQLSKVLKMTKNEFIDLNNNQNHELIKIKLKVTKN